MDKIAVILGSARSDGNTRAVIDLFINQFELPVEVFDLNDYPIEYFDYAKQYSNASYPDLMQELIEYKYWIFATPVYWYSMSAILKNFLDRIKDLMDDHPELVLAMQRVHIGVISCGATNILPDFFAEPFRLTAQYLRLGYVGHVHTWTSRKGQVKEGALNNLNQFADRLAQVVLEIEH